MKKLNIGTNPNDGTGDTLRDAFKKINDNIDEVAALGLKMGTTHIESLHDIEVPKQTLSGDPAVVEKDDRLITVSNAFEIEKSLKEYVEQNFMENKPRSMFTLEGIAPKMAMKVDDPSGVVAAMEVLYGDRVVAHMQWYSSNQEFQFSLFDKTSGVTKATWYLKTDGHAYIGNDQVMTDKSTEKMIREFRSTVEQDTAALHPTRAECITAFKKLPHFDWAKDDDFYIKDAGRTKVVLVKYRANGATDEASAGDFWFEVLNKAK